VKPTIQRLAHARVDLSAPIEFTFDQDARTAGKETQSIRTQNGTRNRTDPTRSIQAFAFSESLE